jgi:hypothetical protein
MTLQQFDNGYWYTAELQEFAQEIGIPQAKRLRKDELERAVNRFLETGKAESPTRRNLSPGGTRDTERGLRLDLPVAVYTNDRETKDFLEREAKRIDPTLKRRSGARYRLNRWREERLTAGARITYRDLVHEYVRLNREEEPFARIPHGRYINFMADFLAAERGATRSRAIRAWKELKALDAPKTYRAWREHRAAPARPGRG